MKPRVSVVSSTTLTVYLPLEQWRLGSYTTVTGILLRVVSLGRDKRPIRSFELTDLLLLSLFVCTTESKTVNVFEKTLSVPVVLFTAIKLQTHAKDIKFLERDRGGSRLQA